MSSHEWTEEEVVWIMAIPIGRARPRPNRVATTTTADAKIANAPAGSDSS